MSITSANINHHTGRNSVVQGIKYGAPYAQESQNLYRRDDRNSLGRNNILLTRRNARVPIERSRRIRDIPRKQYLGDTEIPYVQQRTASTDDGPSSLESEGRQSPQPHTAKGTLLRIRSYRRKQVKRTSSNQWSVQDSELLGRSQQIELGRMARRGHFDPRTAKDHKPKETKQQKEIDGAHKLLNDDLAKERKAQDKAAAKGLKSLDKAQTKAQKSTASELKHEQKHESQDQQKIDKAQSNLAKVEADKGKPGKAGKKYAKAEQKLEKANGNLAKQKSQGTSKLKGINDKEDKSINKAGQKLDKDDKKAHSDQFGSKGARIAKEHPTAWQKFKKVMAKIGNAIDWAITGISLLIPGAEEEGLARLTAKGAEMIAEKAAKAGAKKGAHAGLKKLENEQQHKAVTAAKTESDAQVAAAEANAQRGKNQFNSAKQNIAHPAAAHHRRNAGLQSRSFAAQ